jgi:hypothetical protein
VRPLVNTRRESRTGTEVSSPQQAVHLLLPSFFTISLADWIALCTLSPSGESRSLYPSAPSHPPLTINLLTPSASFQPFASIANDLVSSPSTSFSSFPFKPTPTPTAPTSSSSAHPSPRPSASSPPFSSLSHLPPNPLSKSPNNNAHSTPLPLQEITVPLIDSLFRHHLPLLSDPDLLIIHHLSPFPPSSSHYSSYQSPPSPSHPIRLFTTAKRSIKRSLASLLASTLPLSVPPAIQLHGFPPWLLRVTEI